MRVRHAQASTKSFESTAVPVYQVKGRQNHSRRSWSKEKNAPTSTPVDLLTSPHVVAASSEAQTCQHTQLYANLKGLPKPDSPAFSRSEAAALRRGSSLSTNTACRLPPGSLDTLLELP